MYGSITVATGYGRRTGRNRGNDVDSSKGWAAVGVGLHVAVGLQVVVGVGVGAGLKRPFGGVITPYLTFGPLNTYALTV